jgi:hypothetical protein
MPEDQLPETTMFEMPTNIIEQVYELSGNADKYKGVVLAYLSEDGSPVIYSKFDSQIVELGMRKALGQYLQSLDDSELSLGFDENDFDKD